MGLNTNGGTGFSQYIEKLPPLDLSEFTDFTYLFSGFRSLQNVVIQKMPMQSVDLSNMFWNCQSMTDAPEIPGQIEYMNNMFTNCSGLLNVPVYDMSHISELGFRFTFQGCSSLTEESLNNIMQMCINATNEISSAAYRTLKLVGLSQAQAETCMTLSNYQAFLDAGWTTGY